MKTIICLFRILRHYYSLTVLSCNISIALLLGSLLIEANLLEWKYISEGKIFHQLLQIACALRLLESSRFIDIKKNSSSRINHPLILLLKCIQQYTMHLFQAVGFRGLARKFFKVEFRRNFHQGNVAFRVHLFFFFFFYYSPPEILLEWLFIYHSLAIYDYPNSSFNFLKDLPY